MESTQYQRIQNAAIKQREWRTRVRSFLIWPLVLSATVILFVQVLFTARAAVHRAKRDAADDVTETCGAGVNPNGHFVDLSEPVNPGPFHDLTQAELIELRTFLENHPEIQAATTSANTAPNDSYIFLADLWVPPKAEVLSFLDAGGSQPPRQARVMMFRGDKNPPVVEEWICGPLPDITDCHLLQLTGRRNPVEFSSRPFNKMEFAYISNAVLPEVDRKIGHILRESYNATLLDCEGDITGCLALNPIPYGSALAGNLEERRLWLWALYKVPYQLLHPVDFGMLFQLDGSDASKWGVEKFWYAGLVYDTLDELVEDYDAGRITKSTFQRPVVTHDLYSTLYQRGDPSPPNPQRPPTQVEPDGKRYTVNKRKVDYLGWEFNFRMSSFSGPALFDIRFQGERIAYELALSEIAAYYSGNSPLSQSTDYVDSGAMSSLGSKSLVPGGDCPDHATLINFSVMNQFSTEASAYDSVFCLFEHNNNYPLRRHSQYPAPSGFYGGMLDSVLILRSALVVGNYDYIVDFIFHQNGALETRLMSTGYIQSNVYREVERLYGFKIEENILGNLHHHMMHLKADLDINGVANRYETLDILQDATTVTWDPSVPYTQTKFVETLKTTEQDALYKYNFDTPKDHIVHNDAERNEYGEKRAFRIHLSGMSKNLFPEGEGNEPVISWARHQIAVTRHKDEEIRASSNYGMYDTLNPVVDFSRFYGDDESIVDEDLVFWLTLGLHHIPHTEDLPVTPTAGNHLTAFLLLYNYFKECPSMGSRDAIYVEYKDISNPSQGVTLDRNGNSRDTCLTPKSNLEELLEDNPDLVLESRRPVPTI